MHPPLTGYFTVLAHKGRSATTLKMVRQELTTFGRWWQDYTCRPFDPSLVRPDDIRLWCQGRQRLDHAPTTINKGLAVLRGYFGWLEREQVVSFSPMADLPDLPIQPLAPRSLPPAAIDALLREVQGEPDSTLRRRNTAILAVLVYAGLRVQEVCDLQLCDLDVSADTLLVRHGKAGKARRIPLHPSAVRILQDYLRNVRCPEGVPPVGSAAERHSIWVGRTMTTAGQPWTEGVDQRLIQRLIKGLGQAAARRLRALATVEGDLTRQQELSDLARQLGTVTPHMLRHSLAKRMLERGAQLTEIQRILGHSRLETTARYVTPSEEDLRVALLKAGV